VIFAQQDRCVGTLTCEVKRRHHRAHLLTRLLSLFISPRTSSSGQVFAAAGSRLPVCVVVSSSPKLLPRQQQKHKPNLNFLFRFPTSIPSHTRFCSSTSPSPSPHLPLSTTADLESQCVSPRSPPPSWLAPSPPLTLSPRPTVLVCPVIHPHSHSAANFSNSPRYQHLHRN
jgi:hypothetical protein